MPSDPAINTLLVRVMSDHDVTQRALADWMGCDRSFVTRMCNGTSAVTADALRVLYRLTRDPRLTQAVADSGDCLLLDLSGPEINRPDVDLATLLVALNGVQAVALDRMTASRGDSPQTLAAIDTAIKHLLMVRRRVADREPIPFSYRPARRLAEQLSA